MKQSSGPGTLPAHDNLNAAGSLAANLPGLLLQAEKVAHTFMKGVHGRRRVGLGESFWQFRNYMPGDSPRDIDWRQTAKSDEAFIRQREWEASQTLWLYRDASESMNFRSSQKRPFKKDYAEVLLLALAIITLNGGEQVSLLGTDLAPQTNYNSIQRIAEYLKTQTSLVETGRPVSSRSHAVMISDFYFPVEDLEAFCDRLALRQVKGFLIQVHDPAEKTLPYGGRMKFYDIENDRAAALNVQQVEAVREEYQARFIAHQGKIAAMAKGIGWSFRSFSTSEKHEAVLAQLYEEMAVK